MKEQMKGLTQVESTLVSNGSTSVTCSDRQPFSCLGKVAKHSHPMLIISWRTVEPSSTRFEGRVKNANYNRAVSHFIINNIITEHIRLLQEDSTHQAKVKVCLKDHQLLQTPSSSFTEISGWRINLSDQEDEDKDFLLLCINVLNKCYYFKPKSHQQTESHIHHPPTSGWVWQLCLQSGPGNDRSS